MNVHWTAMNRAFREMENGKHIRAMPTIKWFFRFYGHTNIINITWPPIRFGSRKVAKKPFNWKLSQQSFADVNILIGCTYFWPWTQWSLKFERAASSTRMCQSLTNLREFLLWFLGFFNAVFRFFPLSFSVCAYIFYWHLFVCGLLQLAVCQCTIKNSLLARRQSISIVEL